MKVLSSYDLHFELETSAHLSTFVVVFHDHESTQVSRSLQFIPTVAKATPENRARSRALLSQHFVMSSPLFHRHSNPIITHHNRSLHVDFAEVQCNVVIHRYCNRIRHISRPCAIESSQFLCCRVHMRSCCCHHRRHSS